MKVLLKKNVGRLGKIGDVVNVKPGYARNYLVPRNLAVEPTEANIRSVQAAKQAYLEELAKMRAEIEAKAAVVAGKSVTIAARANVEGLLYGSIGPAQIAAALANEGVFVEPENIVLDSPIRQLDKYDLKVTFAEDIFADISVWVVPIHDEAGEAQAAEPAEGEDTSEPVSQ